ncbi:MAG: hypothetical protein HRT54_24350 [Colwellia sp.]|nr:hypothetical protein [Colwellia sp.]
MEFNKLTKAQKIACWTDIEEQIKQCIFLCGNKAPQSVTEEIEDYLSHNELGIAIELLVCSAIQDNWSISKEAKCQILNTLISMDYHKTDIEEFQQYESWLNAI